MRCAYSLAAWAAFAVLVGWADRSRHQEDPCAHSTPEQLLSHPALAELAYRQDQERSALVLLYQAQQAALQADSPMDQQVPVIHDTSLAMADALTKLAVQQRTTLLQTCRRLASNP
jgi:hypothetical protein